MSALAALGSLLVLAAGPLLGGEPTIPEPEDVKAGWGAFAIFLALATAVVLLGISLRKHLGRVDFEETNDRASEPATGGDGGREAPPVLGPDRPGGPLSPS